MTPPIRYARSGNVHIAYTTLGEGEIDIVLVPGFVSNIDTTFDPETLAPPLAERLARFARVILFDKRGTGLSDRDVGIASLDERMDDLRAVMDAAGSERASLLGVSEGGPMSILFAATFPERTTTLALSGSFATFVRTDDQPWMPTREARDHTRTLIERFWGTGQVLATFLSAEERTDEVVERLAAAEVRSASPSAVDQLMAMNCEIDVRAILPTISVPTLVTHHTVDETVPFEAGQYLAEHIPGARFVPVDLAGHLSLDASNLDWVDDYEEFVTGVRPTGLTERVLSTVLFTDIVSSTDQAVNRGDASWRKILDRHDDIIRRELERHRGVHVKHTGDGVLARFDGPARAVVCGLAITDSVRTIGLSVRTGVHTGEIELRGDDIGGVGVHIGARIMALAHADQVLVSRTVRDLTAGSGLAFADHGEHELRGVPERWQVFAATAAA